jgi:hypothetical protein
VDTKDIINKMIDDIIDGNNTEARDSFDAAISNKLTDALDAKKIELAQSVYSREEQDEPVSSEE